LRRLATPPASKPWRHGLGSGLVVENVDITDAPVVDALRRPMDGQVLDLLFVNAGITGPPHQDAARVASEEITALFLTNAVGPIRLARIFLDLVRDGPGIVAFMTSGIGSVANNTVGGSELYRASKAALNSLARSFAARLGGRQITVLAVAPGWVRTDIGGRSAPLSAEASVRGIVDVLEARRGSHRHGFVDYRGCELPW
jgi:NAD(P)-dependent dehydrogenase (short-subunit alcohol dehydrogenase family)